MAKTKTTKWIKKWTATAKSHQSCPTLCDPIDGSPPGSPIPGILQARTLEWVAISFSNAWKWKVKVKSLSHVWLLATPCTAAYQAPPSMGFSRQEYWSGVPLPSPNKCINIFKNSLGGILYAYGYYIPNAKILSSSYNNFSKFSQFQIVHQIHFPLDTSILSLPTSCPWITL